MGKSLWPIAAPFNFLTPALMKLFWGESAATGHNHNELDEDGSCPQIDLTSAVSGILPVANMESNISRGSVDIKLLGSDTDTPLETGTLKWYRQGAAVSIEIGGMTGAQAGVNSGYANIIPDVGDWPDDIVQGYAGSAGRCAVQIMDNGAKRVGVVVPPEQGSSYFQVFRCDESAFSGTGAKGLPGSVFFNYIGPVGS